MNVVLVGYGRLGKEIETVLINRGHQVLRRIDTGGFGDSEVCNRASLDGADGVIEFALADGIMDRLEVYAEAAIPVVVGTTGWDALVPQGEKLYKTSPGALLKGSNFSIGAHLFFRLTAAAAALINGIDDYDAALVEYHHNKKADYPSGTAITAAEGILELLDRKKYIMPDLPEGPVPPEALQVAAVRVGSVPGIHEMRMDSSADFITVRHEARGRQGFALGAVRGLEWLEGKKGWFDAEVFINDLLTGGKQ